MSFNINDLLQKTTRCLSNYLNIVLPQLLENWWKEAVVYKLSYQQQRRIEQNGVDSLFSLDLAALLRILDKNWRDISQEKNISYESFHFIKEMQTIRNKWAHAATEEFQFEDVYRDLDTLQRFVTLIDADETFIQEICSEKKLLLKSQEPCNSLSKTIVDKEPTPKIEEQKAEFAPGQMIFLKSNTEKKGAVLSTIHGKPENRYNVYIDGKSQIFYASQLQLEDQKDNNTFFLSYSKFNAYLTALQIQHPSLSTLYSLNAARIDYVPYQFRPVMKFIRSDRPRLLIADGVGVGKTIEAGLIMRELQARRDIRSILIICPRPLVTERKWEIEMKRFEEKFVHLDGRTLRYCITEMDLEGSWPEQYKKSIMPYSLFDETLLYGNSAGSKRKRKIGLLDLDPPPRFDLVIVDEAHHIRNSDTFRHKAVRFFCDHAEAVIFLSATPIQMGSFDLFVLLNVLRPDLIIDQNSFKHMAEPNPHINRAVSLARGQETDWTTKAIEALKEAAATLWGQALLKNKPKFLEIYNQLSCGNIQPEKRIQLITDLEALHTFARIINRTRRRDIDDFTIRKPETVLIEFTPEQKILHDDLLQIQSEIFSSIHGDANVNFMLSTIRRQASSCIFGLIPFLQEILNRHIDELSWDEADNTGEIPSDISVRKIESSIKKILELAHNLSPEDPKLEALITILNDKQNLKNNRVMLFSSFRHTLRYLNNKLVSKGFRVGLVHGGIPDEERSEIRRRFEMNRQDSSAIDIMLLKFCTSFLCLKSCTNSIY